MRTIALVLGDNDYGYTFRALLESIYRALHDRPNMSQVEVVRLVQVGIEFHYRAYQQRLASEGGTDSVAELARTLGYLLHVKVLFDEEAERDIQEKDHNHGAWYLEMATGQVFSY